MIPSRLEAVLANVTAVSLTEWALLGAILAVCIYASYTDIVWGKVRNAWTYGLLVWGCAGQLLLVAMERTDWGSVGGTILAGLLVAMLLYWRGLWGPGDGKLYWAVVVAMPPTLLSTHRLLSVDGPVGAVAVNSLMVEMLLVLGLLATRWRGRGAGGEPKWRQTLMAAGRATLTGGGIAGAVYVAGAASGMLLPLYGAVILVVVGGLLLEGHARRPWAVGACIVAVCFGAYAARLTEGLATYAGLVGLSSIVLGAYQVLGQKHGKVFVRPVEFGKLEPGMTPAVAVVPNGGASSRAYRMSAENRRGALTRIGEALSARQVEQLVNAAKAGRIMGGTGKLEVEETVPFAPFILVAVVLTVLLSGSPVQYATSLGLGG